MNQHPVPQQISSYQFRLVGDMTLKQFFQLASGILIAVLIYSTELYTIIKVPLIIFSIAAGAAFAFLPLKERPLSVWIFAFFRSIYSPTEYSWGKPAKQYQFFSADTSSTSSISPGDVKIAAKDEKRPAPLAKLEQKERLFLKKMNLLLRGDEEEYQKLTNQSQITGQNPDELLASLGGTQIAPTSPRATVTTPYSNQQTGHQVANSSVYQKTLTPTQLPSTQPTFPAQKSQSSDQKKNINELINPSPRHAYQETSQSTPQSPQIVQQPLPSTAQHATSSQYANVTQIQQANISPQPSPTQPQEIRPATQSATPAYPNTQTIYSQQNTAQPTQNTPQPVQTTANSSQQNSFSPELTFSRNAPPPTPPDRAGNITGQVMDPAGQVVEGAILEVTDEKGSPLRAVKSNKNGHFSVVTPLHNGVYNLVTEKDGFVFEPMKFEVIGEVIPPFAIRASAQNQEMQINTYDQ